MWFPKCFHFILFFLLCGLHVSCGCAGYASSAICLRIVDENKSELIADKITYRVNGGPEQTARDKNFYDYGRNSCYLFGSKSCCFGSETRGFVQLEISVNNQVIKKIVHVTDDPLGGSVLGIPCHIKTENVEIVLSNK